jgi:hypothetical protein
VAKIFISVYGVPGRPGPESFNNSGERIFHFNEFFNIASRGSKYKVMIRKSNNIEKLRAVNHEVPSPVMIDPDVQR